MYVLDAYEFGLKKRQKELHEEEAPVSLLSSLFANQNRDPKKKKKPYTMEDFFLYQPKEDQNVPTFKYGAAAMRLIEMGLFPRWGLFVYKDLKHSAAGEPPELLAFIHESAILIAPLIKDGSVRGMLICEDKAFNKVLTMRSPCEKEIEVKIPAFDGSYAAIEDMELNIIS